MTKRKHLGQDSETLVMGVSESMPNDVQSKTEIDLIRTKFRNTLEFAIQECLIKVTNNKNEEFPANMVLQELSEVIGSVVYDFSKHVIVVGDLTNGQTLQENMLAYCTDIAQGTIIELNLMNIVGSNINESNENYSLDKKTIEKVK